MLRNGLAFPNVPPSITWLTFYEILDSHQYDKLIPLRSGMTVVDAGASMGIFTIYAAQKVGSTGRVIAFEPEATSYQALVENIKANNLTNVTAVNMGLWGECGCKQICKSQFIEGSSMFECANGQNVKVARLDKILPKLGVDHVDFMKIDTEGAANEILKGATNFLDRIDNFAIAAYHKQENPWEMTKLLQSYGFHTATQHRFAIFPYVYATRDRALTLQEIESWKLWVGVGVAGLLGYILWKNLKK